MDDFTISRQLTNSITEQILWSKDGTILFLFRGELAMLSTKDTKIDVPIQLPEIYSLSRLSGTLANSSNFLLDVSCDEESIRVGQCKAHGNLFNAVSASFSSSGISDFKNCLILLVSDTYNGFIFEFVNGILNPICSINEEISQFHQNEFSLINILKKHQLAKLRVHSLVWAHDIDIEYFNSSIWPLVGSSLFVCFTESDETWIYKFVGGETKIKRVLNFKIGLNEKEEEYVKIAKLSDWIEGDNNDGDKILYCYLGIVTIKNKLYLKKLQLNLTSNELSIDEQDETIQFNKLISLIEFTKFQNQLLITIVMSNQVNFIRITDSKILTEQLSTFIIMNSIVQFLDVSDNNLLHILMTNTTHSLIHFKINLEIFDIINKNYYDYHKNIDSNELPIFDKINKLNMMHTFIIDSISLDPSGNFIGFSHIPYTANIYIDHRVATLKDSYKFSIVKAQEGIKDIDLFKIDKFNSLQTSPFYRKQIYLLMNGLNKKRTEFKTMDYGKDGLDLKMNNEINKGLFSIESELFLNEEIEHLRMLNSFTNNNKIKLRILKMLANTILKMVDKGELSVISEEDKFIYLQYSRLVGRKIDDDKIVNLQVPGLDFIESFKIESNKKISQDQNGGQEDNSNIVNIIGGTICSLEGRQWKFCELTLLPILDPNVKMCGHCGSRVVGHGDGSLVKTLLSSISICLYCGGRYINKHV